MALKFASPDLRGNRELVLAAVHENWKALEYAPDELRADKNVVLAAVSQGGHKALCFASPSLRRDSDVVTASSKADLTPMQPGRPGASAGPGAGPSSNAIAQAGTGQAKGFVARQLAPEVALPEVDGPQASKETAVSYTWLESGVVEVKVPEWLGAPLAEILRPGDVHGQGVQGMGLQAHLHFMGLPPGQKGQKHHFHLRLPLPSGNGAARSLVVQATSPPSKPKATVEERRIDPEDDLFWTLAQLREKYSKRFTEERTLEYWDSDCELLDESVWLRHEPEPASTTFAVRPSGGRFVCTPAPASNLASQADVLAQELQERGWGIVDGFLQSTEADVVHLLLRQMWAESKMKKGMIGGGIQKKEVRGDLFAIGELQSLPAALKPVQARVQQLVAQLGKAVDALQRTGRVECEPPMLAIYPGGGARYIRHFDGLDGPKTWLSQRRVCTLILYLNPFWCERYGGQLRLYPDARMLPDGSAAPPPSSGESSVTVEPFHGRLLAFLCEGCNAHEVLPSWRPRFACTWWVREQCAATS